MTDHPTFYVLPFQRRRGRLVATDPIGCGPDEDRAFRIGRCMSHRVAGLAFFRIESSSDGDAWTEVELLCTHGDVPEEAA